jgi:hypothetical protein
MDRQSEERDRALDEQLEETFPASDATSPGSVLPPAVVKPPPRDGEDEGAP